MYPTTGLRRATSQQSQGPKASLIRDVQCLVLLASFPFSYRHCRVRRANRQWFWLVLQQFSVEIWARTPIILTEIFMVVVRPSIQIVWVHYQSAYSAYSNPEDRRSMLFRNTGSTAHSHVVVPTLNHRNNMDIKPSWKSEFFKFVSCSFQFSYCRLAVVRTETPFHSKYFWYGLCLFR
jgi:hypothetical protein